MSVTTNKTRKPTQKEIERRNAFKEMAAALEGELKEGKHTERLAKAVKEVQGLDRYSPLNQLLIVTQCPHATDVAGYVAWQERGYQVRKGEPGIAIRAPHTRQVAESQGNGEAAHASVGFHRTYVWDISQVEPRDGAQTAAPGTDEAEPSQDGEAPEETPTMNP